MTKAQLLIAVQGKAGFVAILSDQLASDSVSATKQKRVLSVETLNADGTKGITNVIYVHDTGTDEAWFYNVEPTAFDKTVVSSEEQVAKALNDYCKANFEAFFVTRVDGVNKWAEVQAFVLNAGNLEKKNVLVFKKGTNPITHLNVV